MNAIQLEGKTDKVKQGWKRVLAGLVLGLVLSALVLQAVHWAATAGPLHEIDPRLLEAWHRATPTTSPFAIVLMIWSKLVTAPVIWPFLAFTSWFLWRQNRLRDAVGIVCAVVLPALVALGAKYIYRVPRPDYAWAIETHWSLAYPSGHVAIMLALCGIITFIGRRRGRSALWTASAIVFTITATAMMAYSRVVLGAHFFSDVLGGVCLGLIWLLIIITMMGPNE